MMNQQRHERRQMLVCLYSMCIIVGVSYVCLYSVSACAFTCVLLVIVQLVRVTFLVFILFFISVCVFVFVSKNVCGCLCVFAHKS